MGVQTTCCLDSFGLKGVFVHPRNVSLIVPPLSCDKFKSDSSISLYAQLPCAHDIQPHSKVMDTHNAIIPELCQSTPKGLGTEPEGSRLFNASGNSHVDIHCHLGQRLTVRGPQLLWRSVQSTLMEASRVPVCEEAFKPLINWPIHPINLQTYADALPLLVLGNGNSMTPALLPDLNPGTFPTGILLDPTAAPCS